MIPRASEREHLAGPEFDQQLAVGGEQLDRLLELDRGGDVGVAVQSGRAVLDGHPRAAMTWGDITDPAALLATPEVTRLINFAEPVGLLMLGVLHYLPDESDPYGLVASYRDLIARGSYLVISHGTADGRPAPVQAMVDLSAADQPRAYMRGASEVARFLDGLAILPPGVVFLPDWRPDPGDDAGTAEARAMAYAAAAHKP